MSDPDADLQHFTATGRSIPDEKDMLKGRAMNSLSGSECLGTGPANFAPVLFTGHSIVNVAVQPPPPYPGSMLGDDEKPAKEWKKRLSMSALQRSMKTGKQPKFIMKEMTREEYLKHYAKDESGKYCGTEEPAADCMFSNVADYMKYRPPPKGYKEQMNPTNSSAGPGFGIATGDCGGGY